MTNEWAKIGTLRTISRLFLKEFMALVGKDRFVYFTSFICFLHGIWDSVELFFRTIKEYYK